VVQPLLASRGAWPLCRAVPLQSPVDALARRYCFGIKHDVRGAVGYSDEASVVFACGHSLVRLETDATSKAQEIVQGTPGAASIDALVSLPSKHVTAFAESFEDAPPTVTLLFWDTKGGKRKKRVLSHPTLDVGSSRIASLAFSADGRFLVVQGAEPEYVLAYISIEKGNPRVLARVRTQGQGAKPILTADAHPMEPSVLLVSGLGVMKMYRYMDDSLRALSLNLKQEPKRFLAHAWLEDDRFVAATDDGDLMLFEHTEFKRVLDTSPSDGRPIDALVSFSKGFLAGCDGGRLMVYERSDDARQYYKLSGEFSLPGDPSRFLALSVSTTEDEVAMVMSSGQAYLFRLANFELHKPEDVVFAPLLAPFHGAASNGDRSVVALATCPRKPILVSAGADRTLRVWSHLKSYPGSNLPADTHPEVELVKRFSESIVSIALHPSGMHLLVGFESGLQLMNLLMEDVRPVKDLPIRRCAALSFSNGGHLFAAANGANVSVYDTYTCGLISKLQGHTDTVTALAWSPDDQFLITASVDSTVRRWAVRGAAKREHNKVAVRDCIITSIAPAMLGPDATGSLVYAVGRNTRSPTESPFLAITFPTGEGAGVIKSTVSAGPYMHGHIFAPAGGATVVAGTCVPGRQGLVRTVAAPFPAGDVPEVSFTDQVCHTGPITAMCVSSDARLVVTGGDDGSLCLMWDQVALSTIVDPADPTPLSAATAGANASATLTATQAAASSAATVSTKPPAGSSSSAAAIRAKKASAAAAAAAVTAAAGPTILAIPGSAGGVVLGSTTPLGGFRGTLPMRDMSLTLGEMPWAEELLVTRSALEGSREQRKKLESSVAEVKAQNKYNATYKDMKNEEKMREIEETYREEVDAEREKLQALREEKAALEDKFDSQMRSMEASQQQELADLEASYKAKIQAEIERYDDLDRKRTERDAAWQEEQLHLQEEHKRHESGLLTTTNAEIADEYRRAEELERERLRLEEEIEKQKTLIETDGDRELDGFKLKYAEKLAKLQKESTQLMFQMSVSRTTRDTLQTTKNQQRAKINSLAQAEQALQETIASLRKDLEGHKKEIQERDETLEEKDARIYDLRKKNQELEKFKFVLNYKIQELQRQIAPRQREIKDMREQTKEMELELLQYHKSNAALDLMIGELKLKRSGLQADAERIEGVFEELGEQLQEMQRGIYAASSVAEDPKLLKSAVTRLYRMHVHADSSMGKVSAAQDAEAVTAEHGRKVYYLERSMDSLRLKMTKDGERHKSDLERLNKEATTLTREINALRRELKLLDAEAAAARSGRAIEVSAPRTTKEVKGTARTMARRGVVGVKPLQAVSTSGRADSHLVARAEAQSLVEAEAHLERLRGLARGDVSVQTALEKIVGPTGVSTVLSDESLRPALDSAARFLAGKRPHSAVPHPPPEGGTASPLREGRSLKAPPSSSGSPLPALKTSKFG
jgi:cilia- and flagella-associated protein 57